MGFGYVVNQLHNQYSFTYTGSTKQTYGRKQETTWALKATLEKLYSHKCHQHFVWIVARQRPEYSI